MRLSLVRLHRRDDSLGRSFSGCSHVADFYTVGLARLSRNIRERNKELPKSAPTLVDLANEPVVGRHEARA